MSEVRLVINMHARPGMAAAYAAAWAPHQDEVRGEDGCLQYELFRSIVHPDHLALLELWHSRAAFDEHWEVERRRAPAGTEYLAHPRTREIGRDSLEIYWEKQEHRYDEERGLWTPRSARREPGSSS
jgi:quinol monooxygenase YgiN